jgi:hypothetical protein
MSDVITREDLREALRDMTDSMERGFDGLNDRVDGINNRLDELNGRTRKSENAIAVQEDRWQRLDRATQVTPPNGSNKEDLGIRGDWKTLSALGTLAAGAASGLIWGLYKVLQAVQQVIK